MKRARPLGAVVLVLCLGIGALAAGCTSTGRALFRNEGCIGCHTFKGQGGRTGPDLTAVSERRTDAWILRQIRNSKENNPRSRMPSFEHLSELELRSLLKYLKS